MQGEIRGLLFDKDGTLFDFQQSWSAWAEDVVSELSEGDAALAEALAAAIGFDRSARRFLPSSPVIAGTPDEAAAALFPVLGARDPARFVAWLNDRAALAPMVPAVPLRPLFDRLSAAGLALGVATNDGEAPARAHLAGAGVADAFGFVAGSDSGFGGKPGPGMCVAFADWAGLAPGRVAMVGDSLHDLHAGRAAGMATVAVLTGVAPAEALAPHADAVLPDIGHLPGWLGL